MNDIFPLKWMLGNEHNCPLCAESTEESNIIKENKTVNSFPKEWTKQAAERGVEWKDKQGVVYLEADPISSFQRGIIEGIKSDLPPISELWEAWEEEYD